MMAKVAKVAAVMLFVAVFVAWLTWNWAVVMAVVNLAGM